MTDMGAMRWCLGIEVIRDRVAGWIKLSQAKYFRDVLTGYGLVPGSCRTASTPAEAKTRFTADSAPSTDKERRWSEEHLPAYRGAAMPAPASQRHSRCRPPSSHLPCESRCRVYVSDLHTIHGS